MVLVKGEVVVKLGWSECPVQTDETKWLGPSELLPIVARIPTKKRLLDGVFLGGRVGVGVAEMITLRRSECHIQTVKTKWLGQSEFHCVFSVEFA